MRQRGLGVGGRWIPIRRIVIGGSVRRRGAASSSAATCGSGGAAWPFGSRRSSRRVDRRGIGLVGVAVEPADQLGRRRCVRSGRGSGRPGSIRVNRLIGSDARLARRRRAGRRAPATRRCGGPARRRWAPAAAARRHAALPSCVRKARHGHGGFSRAIPGCVRLRMPPERRLRRESRPQRTTLGRRAGGRALYRSLAWPVALHGGILRRQPLPARRIP